MQTQTETDLRIVISRHLPHPSSMLTENCSACVVLAPMFPALVVTSDLLPPPLPGPLLINAAGSTYGTDGVTYRLTE